MKYPSFSKQANFCQGNRVKIPLRALGLATLLSFLSGCASYSATALSSLSSEAFCYGSSATQNKDVIIVAKAFNKTDCKRFLDRNVMSKGYQPIQLYIQNNSDKNYLFSLSRISLPHVSPQEVAETVHTSTVGRALGYGVGGLILWPLVIPAVVDGMKSAEANDALDIDFHAKTAGDQIIARHSSFNKLIFVPRNAYTPSFHITLLEDTPDQPRTFSVTAQG